MTLSRRTVVWGIFWGSAILLSTSALLNAFNPQPDPPGHYYGVMTMRPGQSLSVHVTNIRPRVADPRRPADSQCNAEVQVLGAGGELLARGGEAVMPTESFSLNFAVDPPEPDLDGGETRGGTNPPEPDADPPGSTDPPDPDADPPGGDVIIVDPNDKGLRVQVLFTGPASHCVSNIEVGDPFRVGDPVPWRGGGFIHPALLVGFHPQPDPPGKPAR